ncbi:hypothetical protein BYZ73_08965 [Rhodovulum viride]|uniref:HAF family extracellular repeat protein n=2 Tax=Rhodovulum viride TaxID=1231134 RepID=A0ABX9DKD5_9RHOB|nr:hypothetical protein BYZ73_08965 [Rhodovulum viride]
MSPTIAPIRIADGPDQEPRMPALVKTAVTIAEPAGVPHLCRAVVLPLALVLAGSDLAAGPAVAMPPLTDAPERPFYFVVDLGDLADGRATSVPHAISEDNAVVGAAADMTGATHAFYWKGGQMRDLGVLRLMGEPIYSQAEDINEAGQIVGTTYTDEGPAVALWDKSGIALLPALEPDADPGQAHSINARGDITGYVGRPDRKESVALWQGGRLVEIGLPGPQFDTAHGMVINDAGQIAGQAARHDEVRAFRYDAGVWTLLPEFSGGGYASLVNDMNRSGEIVGKGIGESGTDRGFFWDGAVLYDIGDLPGGKDMSHAFGLNDRGEVVGYSAAGNGNAAVLWTRADRRLVDLNDCIDPESGWHLVLAKDINDNGWITGYGIAPNGATHGFALIPE